MKKKNLILPSVVLAVSVVAILLMLVFTTNFLFYYNYNRLSQKGYEGIVNCRKVTEFAYKINPSYSNLQACKNTYSYNLYFDPKDLSPLLLDADTMPNDFYAKCVEYSRKMYDYHFTHKDAYKGPEEAFLNWYGNYFTYDQAIANQFSDYVVSLYLSGEKAESRRLVDEFVDSYQENSDMDDMAYKIYLSEYVNTLHSLEKDIDYQEWIVETEKKYTALRYGNGSGDKETGNLFAKSELYVSFDWQK